MAEELSYIFLLQLVENEKKKNTRKYFKSLRDSSNPFKKSETQFKNCFKVIKETARYIIEKLRPHYDEVPGIPFELKVLAALHFYGHGSYQKSVGKNSLLGQSQSSVSRSIKTVSQLIVRYLAPIFVKFPINQEAKNNIKEKFYEKYGLTNVIGCIDSCHIAIIAPPLLGPDSDGHLYMNKKGYYSINAEMIVDADLKYLSVNARFPGSVQDSEIWTTSPVRAHLRNTHTEHNPSILLGDFGYPLEPWLLTPINTNALTPNEVQYNLLHKNMRNSAEQTFEATKMRFRCLLKHRTLHYSPAVASMIINAVCTLHNLTLSLNDVSEENDEIEADVDDIFPYESPDIQADGNSFINGVRFRNNYIAQLFGKELKNNTKSSLKLTT